jgi:hypothetical protein
VIPHYSLSDSDIVYVPNYLQLLKVEQAKNWIIFKTVFSSSVQ